MEPVGGSRCGVLKACAVCDGHALWNTVHTLVFGCAGAHKRERGGVVERAGACRAHSLTAVSRSLAGRKGRGGRCNGGAGRPGEQVLAYSQCPHSKMTLNPDCSIPLASYPCMVHLDM